MNLAAARHKRVPVFISFMVSFLRVLLIMIIGVVFAELSGTGKSIQSARENYSYSIAVRKAPAKVFRVGWTFDVLDLLHVQHFCTESM